MTTTTRPLVLVDIDGVLNLFNRPAPSPTRYQARAMGYPLTLDSRHPEWFATIEARAEVRWATMWQRHAAINFAPVAGFGHDWEHIDFYLHNAGGPEQRYGVAGFKWNGILHAAREQRPLVYVDDDLDERAFAWADERHDTFAPTLFLAPKPHKGLGSVHYRQIVNFLNQYQPAVVDTADSIG